MSGRSKPNSGGNETKDPVVEAAEDFCNRFKVEKELRTAIAELLGRLQRSNLSAVEGLQHTGSLVVAFGRLKDLEAAHKKDLLEAQKYLSGS